MMFQRVIIPTFLFSLFWVAGSSLALYAQDPGAQQDAEAAREKLLKAADQIEMIQANSETTKTSLESMKADIAQLQNENASLKQQVTDLKTALDQAEAAHAKERQVLIDEVAKMMASGKGSAPSKPSTKKKDVAASAEASPAAPSSLRTPGAETAVAGAANPPATGTGSSPPSAPDKTEEAPVKTQKGFYHIVESGETLTLISAAYRQNGINVTIPEIQKANGLTDKSILKVGQKLFIPKPET